jgi:hypothetical protein
MRFNLAVSALIVVAACNTPGPSDGSRALQGQLADGTTQQAVIFSKTAAGETTSAAVAADGRFLIAVPTNKAVSLIIATRNVNGGFSALKHIGPAVFTLKVGPPLNIGVVHAAAATGGITETNPTDPDGGTTTPTHMCPNASSSSSSDDDKDGSGHDGDGSGDGNSGPGDSADGGSSGSHDGDGMDCHESEDDTCDGLQVSGCGEDDQDDCDNEDEMQPAASDAGVTCHS